MKESGENAFREPFQNQKSQTKKSGYMEEGCSREFDVLLQMTPSICVSSTRYRRTDRRTERI